MFEKKFKTIQWPNRRINVSFTNYSDKSNLKTIFIHETTKMSATDEPACKRLRLNEPSSSSSDDQKAADQQSNHAHEDQPSNSLLRLNDDCFRHIFGYCDKEDWCRLADVCTRLQSIAAQSFSKWNNEMDQFNDREFNKPLFRRIFFKFGHLITSIECSDKKFTDQQIKELVKCVRFFANIFPNLIELKLFGELKLLTND